MDSKLPYSQITMIDNQKLVDSQLIFNYKYPNNGRTGLDHCRTQVLPYKFGKKRQLKTTVITPHRQTTQNPQKLSIRTFQGSTKSQVFQLKSQEQNKSQIINQYPSVLFHADNYKKLLGTGSCSNLRFQSHSYTGQHQNQQQVKKKTIPSKIFKPDPIIVGQIPIKQNSALMTMWKEQRRHRDNGIKCSQTLQWNPKVQKRQLYKIKSQKNLS